MKLSNVVITEKKKLKTKEGMVFETVDSSRRNMAVIYGARCFHVWITKLGVSNSGHIYRIGFMVHYAEIPLV